MNKLRIVCGNLSNVLSLFIINEKKKKKERRL